MRLPPLLRLTPRLLMQRDASSSANPALKRSLVRQAVSNAHADASALARPRSPPDPPSRKAPRLDGSQSPHGAHTEPPPPSRNAQKMSHASHGARSNRGHRPANNSKRGSRGGPSKPPAKPKGPVLPTFEGPLRDQAHIMSMSTKPNLKQVHLDNPKSPLANFCSLVLGKQPAYEAKEGLVGSQKVFRVTVTIEIQGNTILGVGDATSKKDAEKLSALSAIIQLHELNLLDNPVPSKSQPQAGSSSSGSSHTTLSDGTVIDYEKARQFMDYYCRRFNFGKEDITWEDVKPLKKGGNRTWEAVMTVGGRRIGMGGGANKKSATINCYLDVAQYLESCDPTLWKTFVEAAKTGKDLGLAPKVYLPMSDGLDDDIRDLLYDIKRSTLYRNRPSSASSQTVDPSAQQAQRARAPASAAFLEEKSARLKARREEYLANPALEKMRTTRASLPVYTRAEDILRHVDANEVTICMAATGSGKTTQIPQLILDDWIEKGKGAKCNIVCTQPRRLAAIAVADRVAKERGETVGRGSIGYQVRFESKLPDEHGSVTFCTTGIFLKRMQSALLEGGMAGRQSLEDVTHVIVDEVHERDVDTDLLLVVLKRLLADRKAKGKPIKVVLMSATIDPALFQKYFPDDNGDPAKVIEVPGRSFPVEKHFLDDFVLELAESRESRWVFNDKDVAPYLQSELSPAVLQSIHVPQLPSGARERDEDLKLPAALIGLTIAHVLRKSASGHVLVFLPGWDEIMAVNKILLEQQLGMNFRDSNQFSIHLLHSTIPLAEQQVIFDPPKEGVRRIILATNIAETSITIPDVVYVVDTAKVKEQRYDPERHMSSLVSAWVGSSNLNQRAGRAGRHRPGEYYGVLGQRRADILHPYQTVEMKRVDLSNVVMHVKALNFPGMAVEEVLEATIEPPATERVKAAMHDLMMTGALDGQKNLTSLGRVLLQLPVEVQVGRLVLFGSFFRCLDSALTLAAILTNRDPFVSPMHLKKESSEVKLGWSPTDVRSDALATLNAYNRWWELQGTGQYVTANEFVSRNFLSKPTLLMIQKIKVHLLQSLRLAGILDVSAGGGAYVPPGRRRDDTVPAELNKNNDSMPLLAALIAIASQPKFAIRTGSMTYRTAQDKAAFIHPSSVNHRKREGEGDPLGEKQIIAYAEKRQNISVAGSGGNPQKYLVTTTRLDPLSYLLFGAYDIRVTERGLECDDWLPIVGNIDALDDIQRLKYLMEACMLRVFEGITFSRHHRNTRNGPIPVPREEPESESGDDDDAPMKDYSLSSTEIQELDNFTQDIVRILDRYADERASTASRHNSRPATPMASPSFGLSRLPSSFGSRSGTSTPYGTLSAYNSRPGTPGPGPSPLRRI